MTAMPPQTNIAEERSWLNQRRATLMQRRGEVAKLLRNERVDVQERRELQEEQANLTTKIRSVENELSTLDDAELSLEEDRKAAAVAGRKRQREQALQSVRNGIAERKQIAEAFLKCVSQAADLLARDRVIDGSVRRSAYAAIGSRVQDLSLTFLLDEEIRNLFSDVARGQSPGVAKVGGLVSQRVATAIAVLEQAEAE